MVSALNGFSPESYCMYIVLGRLVVILHWMDTDMESIEGGKITGNVELQEQE